MKARKTVSTGSPLRTVFLFISICVLFASCAQVKPAVYREEKLADVATWRVNYTGEADETGAEGLSPRDLRLRDGISSCLQDDHGIRLTEKAVDSSGEIVIQPDHSYVGGFRSVDVVLVGPKGHTLASIHIKNGSREGALFRGDEDFAAFAANAIADVIKSSKESAPVYVSP
jgi:hypothetical protein